MANNADWLNTLNYIDFLRDIGRHFSINRMLAFDSVKLRLERQQELSFLEFNYMILQAYDFVELYRRYGCVLQMGGSDQWGNIVNGIDLGRRLHNAQLFALTSPLITTSSGAKMGKTAAGAVWLNADHVSPYDYWQYWRNTEDADVARFLKLFTVLPLDEIERLAALKGAEINEAKKILATDATALGARPAAADEAAATRAPRSRKAASAQSLPTVEVPRAELKAGIGVLAAFVKAGLASSNGEVRRAIANNAILVNDARVTNDKATIGEADVTAEGVVKLSLGRKRHVLLKPCDPAQAGRCCYSWNCRWRARCNWCCCYCRCNCRRCRRLLSAYSAVVHRKFEHFAQQPRRQRRKRIDVQHRIARLADHFVGDADQAFLFAAEEQPHDRQLAEQIVGAVERHQRAAQMHLIAAVIDHAVDGAAEHRSAHHAVAQHHASRRLVEVDLHAREFHVVALHLRIAGVDRVLQLGFVVNGEVAHRDRAPAAADCRRTAHPSRSPSGRRSCANRRR